MERIINGSYESGENGNLKGIKREINELKEDVSWVDIQRSKTTIIDASGHIMKINKSEYKDWTINRIWRISYWSRIDFDIQLRFDIDNMKDGAKLILNNEKSSKYVEIEKVNGKIKIEPFVIAIPKSDSKTVMPSKSTLIIEKSDQSTELLAFDSLKTEILDLPHRKAKPVELEDDIKTDVDTRLDQDVDDIKGNFDKLVNDMKWDFRKLEYSLRKNSEKCIKFQKYAKQMDWYQLPIDGKYWKGSRKAFEKYMLSLHSDLNIIQYKKFDDLFLDNYWNIKKLKTTIMLKNKECSIFQQFATINKWYDSGIDGVCWEKTQIAFKKYKNVMEKTELPIVEDSKEKAEKINQQFNQLLSTANWNINKLRSIIMTNNKECSIFQLYAKQNWFYSSTINGICWKLTQEAFEKYANKIKKSEKVIIKEKTVLSEKNKAIIKKFDEMVGRTNWNIKKLLTAISLKNSECKTFQEYAKLKGWYTYHIDSMYWTRTKDAFDKYVEDLKEKNKDVKIEKSIPQSQEPEEKNDDGFFDTEENWKTGEQPWLSWWKAGLNLWKAKAERKAEAERKAKAERVAEAERIAEAESDVIIETPVESDVITETPVESDVITEIPVESDVVTETPVRKTELEVEKIMKKKKKKIIKAIRKVEAEQVEEIPLEKNITSTKTVEKIWNTPQEIIDKIKNIKISEYWKITETFIWNSPYVVILIKELDRRKKVLWKVRTQVSAISKKLWSDWVPNVDAFKINKWELVKNMGKVGDIRALYSWIELAVQNSITTDLLRSSGLYSKEWNEDLNSNLIPDKNWDFDKEKFIKWVIEEEKYYISDENFARWVMSEYLKKDKFNTYELIQYKKKIKKLSFEYSVTKRNEILAKSFKQYTPENAAKVVSFKIWTDHFSGKIDLWWDSMLDVMKRNSGKQDVLKTTILQSDLKKQWISYIVISPNAIDSV